jgi:hypothetical protein
VLHLLGLIRVVKLSLVIMAEFVPTDGTIDFPCARVSMSRCLDDVSLWIDFDCDSFRIVRSDVPVCPSYVKAKKRMKCLRVQVVRGVGAEIAFGTTTKKTASRSSPKNIDDHNSTMIENRNCISCISQEALIIQIITK